jgi:Exostosin family
MTAGSYKRGMAKSEFPLEIGMKVVERTAIGEWWFRRFRVCGADDGMLHFRDLLLPGGRFLDASSFAGLSGIDLQRAYFQRGFMSPVVSTAFEEVKDRPGHAGDLMFWQFPCRTEGVAKDLHEEELVCPRFDGDAMHIYLGLPWATWIDKLRKVGDANMRQSLQRQQRLLGVRLSGLRQVLCDLGVRLRVHTVCQHIYWKDMLSIWQSLGVTDAWLSHCPVPAEGELVGLTLHPWRLYAVNVEDPRRDQGLRPGRDPATKGRLASFVGAHADHYLSDIRLRLLGLADQPGFEIAVTNQWHFEDAVYRYQVAGVAPPEESRIDDSVIHYNTLLSDSVFSLCPAGAGPNTLRLWESLAVGSVPVLLGEQPRLPEGGSLGYIDWDSIAVRIPDELLPELPTILNRMPMEEVRRRQRLGMDAFQSVRQQRCF